MVEDVGEKNGSKQEKSKPFPLETWTGSGLSPVCLFHRENTLTSSCTLCVSQSMSIPSNISVLSKCTRSSEEDKFRKALYLKQHPTISNSRGKSFPMFAKTNEYIKNGK